jgi:hypothetical protein
MKMEEKEWITHINVNGLKCPVKPIEEVVKFEGKLQVLFEHQMYLKCLDKKPSNYPDWKMNKLFIYNFSHRRILDEILEASEERVPLYVIG